MDDVAGKISPCKGEKSTTCLFIQSRNHSGNWSPKNTNRPGGGRSGIALFSFCPLRAGKWRIPLEDWQSFGCSGSGNRATGSGFGLLVSNQSAYSFGFGFSIFCRKKRLFHQVYWRTSLYYPAVFILPFTGWKMGIPLKDLVIIGCFGSGN